MVEPTEQRSAKRHVPPRLLSVLFLEQCSQEPKVGNGLCPDNFECEKLKLRSLGNRILFVGAGNAIGTPPRKSKGLYCAGTASTITKQFVIAKYCARAAPGLARSVH